MNAITDDQPTNDSPTSDSPPSEPPVIAGADRLLNKYLAVWLWSIIFGTNGGIVFSLISISGTSMLWKQLAIVLLIPGIASASFGIYALVLLYRALTRYLLPRFFGYWLERQNTGAEPDPKVFAYFLHRAFQSVVAAALCRLAAVLIEIALSAFATPPKF
jgi:hypothetical protein